MTKRVGLDPEDHQNGLVKAETTFSLKDQLFNADKVDYLSGLFEKADKKFPDKKFRKEVMSRLTELELKERIDWIAQCLKKCLPNDYSKALKCIVKALPPELDPDGNDDDFGDFIIAPLSYFVAIWGCEKKHKVESLAALKAITKRFTVEDAIRYFINAFPEDTLNFLKECAEDSNYHVRRLASEGTRPTLPWCQKIKIGYKEPLPILDVLYKDKTRYVTRSVANHLNDISKIEPDLVVKTLTRWQKQGEQEPKEMDYITRHALRTLVKKGHVGALLLLGFEKKPKISIDDLSTHTPKVKLGAAFEFAVTLTSKKKQKILVDYIMEFATEAGSKKTPSQKVFKLKQLSLKKDEVVTLNKRHPMRLMTTRALHPGTHRITLQLNGVAHGSLEFELKV